jgi:hypothetical protein
MTCRRVSLPALCRFDQAGYTQVLWGECVSGALYIEDFVRMARDVGFTDPRVLSAAPIEINDAELKDVVGEAKFYSITYRYVPCLFPMLFPVSPLRCMYALHKHAWQPQCGDKRSPHTPLCCKSVFAIWMRSTVSSTPSHTGMCVPLCVI